MQVDQNINEIVRGFLNMVAESFNKTPALKEELRSTHGWLSARIGLRSDDDLLQQAIIIKDGSINIDEVIPDDVDLTIIFIEGADLLNLLQSSPEESYMMIIRGRVRTEGNTAYMGLWDYLVSILLVQEQEESAKSQIEKHRQANRQLAEGISSKCLSQYREKKKARLRCKVIDDGVKYLEDPYLAQYTLDHFPRLVQFRKERVTARPEVCAEYGKLATDFFVKYGYENKSDGTKWDPNMRCAKLLKYILENRLPVLRENDLIAGSYTPNPILGMVGQPNILGYLFWGELRTCSSRALEPFDITEENIEMLHKHVYPYWADRNMPQWWRDSFGQPLGAKIRDRFFALAFTRALYSGIKSPGFERVLKKGLKGLRAQIEEQLSIDGPLDDEKKATLTAMKISLDAVSAYTKNLENLVRRKMQGEADPKRKAELERLSQVLQVVPDRPARTLYEAVQAIMIMHIALGMETIDDSGSLGRLDQLLQPYFESDLAQISSKSGRDAYIKNTLELIGCLFLRINTHWPLTPEIGTWMNSGSTFNTTIVVGGITPEGEDAVNDMSYIILKVTEMLSMNDPNMHVRYHSQKNSRAFLERVCEVNYITSATPAIHSDEAVIDAILAHDSDMPPEVARNWTPTGCVEPTIPGVQYACTASGNINLAAALEMALNNGTHPLMRWGLGPKTGNIGSDGFEKFDDVFNAFQEQFSFLAEQLIIGDRQLEELCTCHYPEVLMSTLYDDCIEKGRNLTRGGARYNATGFTMIGLTEVVDSLLAIKKLVYDEMCVDLVELKKAVDNNFLGYEKINALIKSRVPRFGSGNPEALAMARRVMEMINGFFQGKKDNRKGHYMVGYWTMNNHIVYGRVTGALPSGRLDGEPFTPGLTPSPKASSNLLDNLLDVAQLDPEAMVNNIAFNVRITPIAKDTPEQTVKNMTDYVETFIKNGGMQLQFNVVNTDTLRDAMANPDEYADLIVRVSGYCGHFTRLQRDLQLEIIGRSEYGV